MCMLCSSFVLSRVLRLATLIELKAKGHIDEAELQFLRAGLAQSVWGALVLDIDWDKCTVPNPMGYGETCWRAFLFGLCAEQSKADVCAYPGSCLGSCSLYSTKRKVFLLLHQQLPEQLPGSVQCRISIGFLKEVLRGGSPWPMKCSRSGSCLGRCLCSCCQFFGFRRPSRQGKKRRVCSCLRITRHVHRTCLRSKTRGGKIGRVWLQQSRGTW